MIIATALAATALAVAVGAWIYARQWFWSVTILTATAPPADHNATELGDTWTYTMVGHARRRSGAIHAVQHWARNGAVQHAFITPTL